MTLLIILLLLAETAGVESRKLLPIIEAAHRLGIGRTRFYELIRAGAIPTVTIGARYHQDGTIAAAGRRLVPIEAVDAYADSLTRESGTSHH